jgi:hypothetical protein
MFKPISISTIESLKKSGSIFLTVDERWASTSTLFSVPHVVYYKKNKSSGLYGKIKLFTCYISSGLSVFEVNNLAESEFLLNEAEEASRYSFLEMVIEDFMNRARQSKKRTFLVSSRIPHTAEILVELGFRIQVGPEFDFTSNEHTTFVGRIDLN